MSRSYARKWSTERRAAARRRASNPQPRCLYCGQGFWPLSDARVCDPCWDKRSEYWADHMSGFLAERSGGRAK